MMQTDIIIGKEEMNMISEGLKYNQTLTELNLRRKGIKRVEENKGGRGK